MSPSPISVTFSPSTPTHSQLLSSLVDDELREARATFPTPPLGQVSPDSAQSLDLAPTTGIRSASTEDSSEEVGRGAAPPGESEDRSATTVLLVRNPDPEEEEGKGSGGVQCEAAQGDPCRFHTPFAVQRCDTNNAANSSKTASATSNPYGPLRVASSSQTFPTSSDSSGTRAKLRSSSRLPMTWDALKD